MANRFTSIRANRRAATSKTAARFQAKAGRALSPTALRARMNIYRWPFAARMLDSWARGTSD